MMLWPTLRALVCHGRVVVARDNFPGLDFGALQGEAVAQVDRMNF